MIGWTLRRLGLRRAEHFWRFRVVITLWEWWYWVSCPFVGHRWRCPAGYGCGRFCREPSHLPRSCVRCGRWQGK
jgi:hypothetical protein